MAELKAYDLYAKAILKDPENLKAFLQEFLPKDLLPHLDLSQLSLVPEEQISLPKKNASFLTSSPKSPSSENLFTSTSFSNTSPIKISQFTLKS